MKSTLTYIVLTILFPVLGFYQLQAQDFVDYAESLGLNIVLSGSGSGSGLSTLDFDKDGLDDISLSSSSGELKFYRNTGNGFDLLPLGILSAGLTEHLIWVDVDNDGDLDIYFTTFEGRQFLYKNNGDFVFQEVTESSGLPTYDAFYFGASFGDYDLDGDLDLYTCKYFIEVYDPDDVSQFNKLYQNQGDGTFVDVTVSSEIYMPPTYSFQSTWFDYNEDGWPDLFVINDRNPVNFLFHNNGDGTFTDVAEEAGVLFPGSDCMSISMSDFDQDGDLDIYTTNTGILSQESHSLFMVNQGDETFQEMSEEYGVDTYAHGWGAVWIDSDNDSWQDLFFVTENNAPFYYYKNVEGEHFMETNELISLDEYSSSYSSSKGDFNNDGYSDIAIQSTSPHLPYVLINQGGDNNYIKVTLQGTVSNSMAIGSLVRVYSGSSIYTEYTHCGENYLGQNSQHLIFGLGPNVSVVDSIQVTYPSRHIDTYYNLSTDTAYLFTEGETYSCEINSSNSGLSFCENDSLILDAGEHIAYYWNTGDTTRTLWVKTDSTYVVTTQNQFGILATDSISLIEYPSPFISALLVHPECHGDSTGSIELINQISVPADSVIWNNETYGAIIEGIPAGLYSYVYIDTNGCKAQGDATILQPSAMEFFAYSTPETDQDEDGSISISVFGGTEPYQIFLDEILVENEITGLAAGDYSFVIIDDNSCQDTLTVSVDIIVSVDEQEGGSLVIFPNPSSDFIEVNSKDIYKEIIVMSANGETIVSYIRNLENRYQIKDLPSGIYIIQITYMDESKSRHKICKL